MLKTAQQRLIEHGLLALTAGLVFVGLILHYTYFSMYEWYVKEDLFLEWMQLMFLLASSLLCFHRSYKFIALGKAPALIFLLGGCLFLFGAGEEISWGQRILGLETPEYFEAYNAQQELNLHNLTVMGVKINKLLFGKILAVVVFFYLILLPILAARTQRIQRWLQRLRIPLPQLRHIVLFLIVGGIIYALDPERKGELVEILGVATFFQILLFPKTLQEVTND